MSTVKGDSLREVRGVLERAWAGVRVLCLEGTLRDPTDSYEVDYPEFCFDYLRVSGPEELLVRHGLITAEALSSLPPCGVCRRPGFHRIERGKTTTRVSIVSGGLDDMLAPIVTPALIWRPLQSA